jgi:hypothetical protein
MAVNRTDTSCGFRCTVCGFYFVVHVENWFTGTWHKCLESVGNTRIPHQPLLELVGLESEDSLLQKSIARKLRRVQEWTSK